jgi:hypothetical protein
MRGGSLLGENAGSVLSGNQHALVLLPGFATVEHGKEGLEGVAWGTRSFRLFEERYSAAGAGLGRAGLRRTVFSPRWLSETQDTTY